MEGIAIAQLAYTCLVFAFISFILGLKPSLVPSVWIEKLTEKFDSPRKVFMWTAVGFFILFILFVPLQPLDIECVENEFGEEECRLREEPPENPDLP